ncbi:MAG: hypothetical protein R2695_21325 [Acidimicrobiales bacterium]
MAGSEPAPLTPPSPPTTPTTITSTAATAANVGTRRRRASTITGATPGSGVASTAAVMRSIAPAGGASVASRRVDRTRASSAWSSRNAGSAARASSTRARSSADSSPSR